MIANFFIPELNNHDVQELWFQQDGATCHTARATIDLLKDTLGDRLISRFGPVNWPPRSCDLTPLDYFLWGYIVRVHYFVKGGFVGHRSRASSKHLSPHLPVDELDSSGVKKGLRCSCKMHVWVSGPQRSRLDVDVSEK
ncbi:uncharacterized protein TNCV_1321151 [Trichonephila clavipes]|nr:uncharacterized protein TNCV_1321151 [Trichonephila clavipes]